MGYYRNLEVRLEAIRRGDPEPKEFLGWERALSQYRKKFKPVVSKLNSSPHWRLTWRPGLRHFFATLSLRETQRYWILGNYSFLALSAICLALAIRSRYVLSLRHPASILHLPLWIAGSPLLAFSIALTLYCAIFNAVVMSRLIRGQHSYDFLEQVWKEILR